MIQSPGQTEVPGEMEFVEITVGVNAPYDRILQALSRAKEVDGNLDLKNRYEERKFVDQFPMYVVKVTKKEHKDCLELLENLLRSAMR